MAFRDSFDQCPRCAVTLEDAHSARGCRSCGGAFLEEPILAEMILQMLPPPPRTFGPLVLSEVQRSGSPLACPQCTKPMTPTRIHDVELDHCEKHGVWFDPDELRITLFRVADPDHPPPFGEWVPIEPAPPPPREAHPRLDPEPGAPRLTLRVTEPGALPRYEDLQQHVIKIGRLRSCHVRLDDSKSSRLHAVIEQEHGAIQLIDLGSSEGTLVNGHRITKRSLEVGDVIQIGDTWIEIVIR